MSATTGLAPVSATSSEWSGLRKTELTSSPRSVRMLASGSATLPWPPMTMTRAMRPDGTRGGLKLDFPHDQVDQGLARRVRPGHRRHPVPGVHQQRDPADAAGSIAVEERHDVAHLLRGVDLGTGLVPVVLSEAEPQVRVGLSQRGVGRARADRVDANTLLQQGVALGG